MTSCIHSSSIHWMSLCILVSSGNSIFCSAIKCLVVDQILFTVRMLVSSFIRMNVWFMTSVTDKEGGSHAMSVCLCTSAAWLQNAGHTWIINVIFWGLLTGDAVTSLHKIIRISPKLFKALFFNNIHFEIWVLCGEFVVLLLPCMLFF